MANQCVLFCLYRCEECGDVCNAEDLRTCDGSYPSCVGAAFPDGGLSRQYSCKRGAVCDDCDNTSGAEHWHCQKCTAGSSKTSDVWGEKLTLPQLDLAANTTHAASPPLSSIAQNGGFFEQPYDAVNRTEANRATRLAIAGAQFGRQGGGRAVQAAQKLLQVFRRHFFSRSAQVAVIGAVNELYEEDLLGTEPASGEALAARSTCLVPKTLVALEGRGSAALVTGDDIESRIVRFSTLNLGQLQQHVEMVIGDVPAYLQSILDDPRIYPKDWFFGNKDTFREYTTEDGMPLFGPEIIHGREWKDKEKTIPVGGVMMGLCVSSDETVGMGGTRYPFRISIANQSMSSRFTDAGTRLAALLPVIVIRRPRNSQYHERLNRSQKRTKRSVQSAAPAHVLADLDVMASTPLSFRSWEDRGDGARVAAKIEVHVRCVLYITDKKEEQALLNLTANGCPRCMSLEVAIAREASEGRADYKDRRVFMRTDGLASCADGARRTVPAVVRLQGDLASLARTHGVTVADARAKNLSVKYDVEVMLHRLTNLFPHPQGPYSAFGTDFLHVYGSGVAAKFILMIDAFLCKFHGESAAEEFRTREDVRNRLDENLSNISSHPGLLGFSTGWWDSSSICSVSSSQSKAFLQQIAFTFVGDPLMVANHADRKRLITLILLQVDIARELTTLQWYMFTELDDLSLRLCLLSTEFQWLHDKLGDDCPGDGMNISKFHDFLSCRRMLEDFGSLQNACSGPFEMRMKTLKANDQRVIRTRADDRSSALFDTQQANELQLSSRHNPQPPVPMQRVTPLTMGRRSFTVGVGSAWNSAVTRLSKTSGGPAFTPGFVDNLEVALNEVLGVPQGAPMFAQAQIVTSESQWIAMPGHTVKLLGGSFAQIVAAAPMLGSRHGGLRFVVCDFALVKPTQRAGMHPEIEMLWLKRNTTLRIAGAADVLERVHVNALRGNHGRPVGDSSEHFLLDTTVDPKFAGPADRSVYLSCPNECGGRLKEPAVSGSMVRCARCGRASKWM